MGHQKACCLVQMMAFCSVWMMVERKACCWAQRKGFHLDCEMAERMGDC